MLNEGDRKPKHLHSIPLSTDFVDIVSLTPWMYLSYPVCEIKIIMCFHSLTRMLWSLIHKCLQSCFKVLDWKEAYMQMISYLHHGTADAEKYNAIYTDEYRSYSVYSIIDSRFQQMQEIIGKKKKKKDVLCIFFCKVRAVYYSLL